MHFAFIIRRNKPLVQHMKPVIFRYKQAICINISTLKLNSKHSILMTTSVAQSKNKYKLPSARNKEENDVQ